MLEAVPHKTSDIIMVLTNGLAVGAVVSPVWLPLLQSVSNVAAIMMPILGVIWLGTQIIRAWAGTDKKK